MKKLLGVAIIAAMGITGCYKEPQTTNIEGNGIKVDLLFEHDGIKVYRFYDGSIPHYFTNKGETSTTQQVGKTGYEETIK